MICPRCNAEVPPGQIACSCFVERQNSEITTRALDAFVRGTGPLWLTSSGHLLPAPTYITPLCNSRLLKRPASERIYRAQLAALSSNHGFCKTCYEAARAALCEHAREDGVVISDAEPKPK